MCLNIAHLVVTAKERERKRNNRQRPTEPNAQIILNFALQMLKGPYRHGDPPPPPRKTKQVI